MRLLFVCLGNICRSPTAEGVVRKLAADAGLDVEVDSCGTAGYHVGEAPDARTIAHARRRGYDLSRLRARQMTAGDFTAFDRIYAMDHDNLRRLRGLAPDGHAHKLSLFLDVPGAPGGAVPDPWAGGPEGFEQVLDLCEAGARALLASLAGPGPG